MQNTKDTFYETLRTRLAALNPNRTIALRGIVRPAVLVEENELPADTPPPDCFRIQWTKTSVDVNGKLPLLTLQCEIAYETVGTAMNSGMDRGRALAAMDAELLAALLDSPRNATKTNYAGMAFGNAAVAMNTNLWWGGIVFGEAETKNNRASRTVTVDVMSYEETGEL